MRTVRVIIELVKRFACKRVAKGNGAVVVSAYNSPPVANNDVWLLARNFNSLLTGMGIEAVHRLGTNYQRLAVGRIRQGGDGTLMPPAHGPQPGNGTGRQRVAVTIAKRLGGGFRS